MARGSVDTRRLSLKVIPVQVMPFVFLYGFLAYFLYIVSAKSTNTHEGLQYEIR